MQNEIVHRIPEHGSGEFRLGTQVVVREYQRAVFFRDGHALDVFDAGRHTLTTANIPLLDNFLGNIFGSTPFRAEVYFVSMREFPNMKWGTPQPIPFRDSDLGMVRLRGFGTFSMQVNDPQLFVSKMVGGREAYTTDAIQGQLTGLITQAIIDLLGETLKSILDLGRLYDEISAGIKAKVNDSFESFGLDLKVFTIGAITPPEKVQEMIDERTAMGAVGEADFLRYSTARGIREAAAAGGTGGEMTGAGVGLGAGLGMGAAMAQQMQTMGAGGQAAPAVPDIMTLSEAAAYMRVGEEDVLSAIKEGQIKAKKIGKSYRISKQAIEEFLSS
jgi:excisionase family DNA binding protein